MMNECDTTPSFKASLPPRKRAKTKEEKEQRRVERIMRNRKAAHASREKKRKHVEFLESYVVDLEKQMLMVKLLNDTLLKDYQGGNPDVDTLIHQMAQLPDLKESKRLHACDIESVGADDTLMDLDDNQDSLPKTPESSAPSPKQQEQDDVPMLLKSRQDSMSDSSDSSPQFISPEATPMSKNKFSLDIINSEHTSMSSGVPQLTLDDSTMSSIPFNDIFIKKENDDFITQIPEMFTFGEKLALDDYQVNVVDNEFDFVELRNPAVIAVEPFVSKLPIGVFACLTNMLFS